MKTPAPPSPVLAMIDTPEDGRFYLLPLVNHEVYNPAIRVHVGGMRPCFVVPSLLLSRGGMYSQGGRKVVGKRRELEGIRASLNLMGKVWTCILESQSPCDLKKQEALAQDLTSRPYAALSHIKTSGAIGTKGGLVHASDYFRNVMALAHWGGLWMLRNRMKKAGKLTDSPGGWAFNESAKLMNDLCRKACPDVDAWGWVDFTGTALKSLIDRHFLDPKIRR